MKLHPLISTTKQMPDTIPNHNAEAAAQLAAMSVEEYALAEKKLLRKLDLRLIPWMTCVSTVLVCKD